MRPACRGAATRARVQELEAQLGEVIQAGLDVLDPVGDVMEAALPLRQEPGDLRFRSRAAEELDSRLPHLEHDGLDPIGRHDLAVCRRRAGEPLICSDRDVEVGDGDPHVVDPRECARHRRPSIGSNTATPRSLPRTRC